MENLRVLEGDNLVTANTFYVRDDQKSVELYTQTREEKQVWMETLYKTIKELYQRKSSLRLNRDLLRPLDGEIGVRAPPRLLRLEAVAKCMECGQMFSMMRKRHNCRACGIVVCAKCSGQKYPLAFEDGKFCRVCRTCYTQLLLNDQKASQEAEVTTGPKGLLEVSYTNSIQ